MTGTIAIFDDRSASGVISAEDGLRVRFDSGAVLAYDAANLAVGQSVTFDVVRGNDPKAFNVCVDHPHGRRPGAEPRETMPPRYVGFDQSGNLRLYRFERVVPGKSRTTVIVNADMALFTKHHVGIQEGPALCLRLLVAALDTADSVLPPPYALTDREMLAYLASRPEPGKRPGSKRAAAAPAAIAIPAHAWQQRP
jgi:cold shock CspA family protein